MVGHDTIKGIEDLFENQEMIKKISPKFSELSLDIKEISKHCKDPVFIAVLLFKLAEERNRTNKLLEQIDEKFDKIMFNMKTGETSPLQQRDQNEPSSILSEQDQMIMHLAHTNGKVTAEDIKTELGYKGKNAASQRLNRLFKDGHLRKMQSGRKMFYLATGTPTP